MRGASQELATLSRAPRSAAQLRGVSGAANLNGDGDRVAAAFKAEGRISDAIGRTGPDEFTVFAPATDRPERHACRTIGRYRRGACQTGPPSEKRFSSSNGTPQVDPRELLERARSAVDAS